MAQQASVQCHGVTYPRVSVVQVLLDLQLQLQSQPKPAAVVFLGDGNTTFSRAFRLASRLFKATEANSNVANGTNDDRVAAIEAANDAAAEVETQEYDSGFVTISTELNELYGSGDDPLVRGLNAMEMGSREQFQENLGINMPSIVLFLQCPFFSNYDRTNHLVTDFFRSAAQVQKAGEYLFLGISSYDKEEYRRAYGDPKQYTDEYKYYNVIGADNGFTTKMLDFGYWHMQSSGKLVEPKLRKWGAENTITLCFQRNGRPAPQPT